MDMSLLFSLLMVFGIFASAIGGFAWYSASRDGEKTFAKGFMILTLAGIVSLVLGFGCLAFSPSASTSSTSSTSSSKQGPMDSYRHDKFDAAVIAKRTVEKQLKSPSTAKFCETKEASITCTNNTWTVCGWVDAQNSFGATLRCDYEVKFTFTSTDEYVIDSCTIK